MEAITAQLLVLKKELKDLGEKIEKLYDKLAEETDDKKKEKLNLQIKQQEEEKKQLTDQRNDLHQKLTAGGMQPATCNYNSSQIPYCIDCKPVSNGLGRRLDGLKSAML